MPSKNAFRGDMNSHFVAKCGEKRPLGSYRKVTSFR